MAQVYKYTIHDINNIILNGFEYKLNDDVVEVISNLTSEVGSPTYIKTPNFQKQNTENDDIKAQKYQSRSIYGGVGGSGSGGGVGSGGNGGNGGNGKNSSIKRHKGMSNKQHLDPVKDDDWETIRTFSTTKMEQHEGIDVFIDNIRSNLNKMSIKTYDEINTNVVSNIDQLISQNISDEEAHKISSIIFDIVSSNRFYSKLYSNLYSNLISKYDFIKSVFKEKEASLGDILNNVYYVSPDENYDLFCKMNNENEKRKAFISFFVNLVLYDVIAIGKIEELLLQLLDNLNVLIKEENKKFVVDEYIEIIFILYNKELFNNENKNFTVDNHTKIVETIKHLAGVKVKTYPSLSSKSIFKLMDIIEM
jgi:hypothetical protein